MGTNVNVTGAGGFNSPFFGTSAAAPHIAGLVALLLSGYPGQSPYTLLQDSATPRGSPIPNGQFGHGLPNLQLLSGVPNQEKSDSQFQEWFEQRCSTPAKQTAYRDQNYIPEVDLSLENFRQFFNKRKHLLQQKLERVLDGFSE